MCTENYHWHHDYVRLAWDSGFCFDLHKAKSNFDWSSVGLVDIDRVSRDRDIAVVEKHITTVLHFTLDEDQTKILDPTFVKVFRLSQLSVQYLQFCKRYLDNTVVLLKKQLSKTNEENLRLGEHCDELEGKIAELKKELKLSLQYQPAVVTETGAGSVKCSECAKVFLTEEFLLAHMKRRHTANPLQKETDKLQLEIKELKERLNSAVQVEHSSGDTPKDHVRVDLLQNKFEQLKEHVEKELNMLRDQKQYQEKYDRWFELVFQRLENSQRELLEKKESAFKDVTVNNNIVGDDGDKICTKESSTQTALEVVKEVKALKEVMTDTQGEDVEKAKGQTDLNLVKKMQEDIRVNTESHLDQIQDVLQQKLTGGLEQIQTQMNTFWEKINELQSQQPSLPSPQAQESSSTKSENKVPEINKPQPVPRVRKLADDKQAKHAEIIPNALSDSKQVLQTYYVTTTTTNHPSKKERFLSERAESDVALKRSSAKLKVYKKKSPKVLSTKKIVNEEKSRESSPTTSQSEDVLRKVQAQIKPSNTSTLAQRSISSLKNLLNDHDVQQGLKEELEEMVNLRLKEIGVSPHWLGLPQRSFAQALRIIVHRAQLFAKKNPEYLSVRANILDEVESQLGLASPNKSKPKITVKTKPSRRTRRRSRTKEKKTKGGEMTIINPVEVELKKPECNKAIIKQVVTPTKKKVLFDLETSSSVSDKSKRGNEHVQDKENVLSLTKQNVESLISQPRTAFKSLDTDTSATSSVLDGSKRQAVAKTTTVKSANDEVSDWEMSDILT